MFRNAKTIVCIRFFIGTAKFQTLILWELFSMRAFHLFPAILPQETSTGATVTSPWNQSSAPTDTHPYTRFPAGLCITMCFSSCVNIIQNRKQIWTYWFILQPQSLAQEHFHTVFLLCRFHTHLIIVIISWYLRYIYGWFCVDGWE